MNNDDMILEARGLHLRFGRKRALDGLDLAIRSGSVTVLLGPNGSGKSTFLRTALGMLKPTSGSLRVLGLDPTTTADEVRKRVGYVPDRPDVPPWMKFGDLCRFLRGHYQSWDQRLVDELVDRFEVPRQTKLGAMSKGQGMKAMLVLATATRPELLLLDEPFGGLDPIVREEVCAVVLTTLREREQTILCATHELELAARLADRVAVLRDGRLIADGSLGEVLGEGSSDREPTATPQGLRELLKTNNQRHDAEETLSC